MKFSAIGDITFLRTVSRLIDGKWETWQDNVQRFLTYTNSLHPVDESEIEDLRERMHELKVLGANRTHWIGGTEFIKKFPDANFNCASVVIDYLNSITESMYLALLGCGTGFRNLFRDAEKMPKMYPTNVTSKEFTQLYPTYKDDNTYVRTGKGTCYIQVGDSKNGWSDTMVAVLASVADSEIDNIVIDYDFVRPEGTPLKSSAGEASGHEVLHRAIEKICMISTGTLGPEHIDGTQYPIDNVYRPIHWLDTVLCALQCVFVGGVRRTASIFIFSPDDMEIRRAKKVALDEANRNYVLKQAGREDEMTDFYSHRFFSNNSVFLEEKPTKEQIETLIMDNLDHGEPGFINAVSARLRCEGFEVVNPCAEILLRSAQMCNLTSVNMMAHVVNGVLDLVDMLKSQRHSARIGLRQTMVELTVADNWNDNQKKDRLLGCSITGIMDAYYACNGQIDLPYVLAEMKRVANEEAVSYAAEIGINPPKLVTTIKPDGTQSLYSGVSPGIHHPIFQFAIKNMRAANSNPVLPACRKAGFTIVDDPDPTTNGVIIQIPIKSHSTRGQDEVPALEQLEMYKTIMKHYVNHNASNTITISKDEVPGVVDWMYENWDVFVCVSWMPKTAIGGKSPYLFPPYEQITEEIYEEMILKIRPIDVNDMVRVDLDMLDDNDSSCSTGMCPVR